ncbi:MAG: Stp1/IreP family PP2C-type Ser/Thr phosphatase, partial [Acidimicrobiales bacterium]
MTVLRSGSATDVGRVRSSNQDLSLEAPNLYAVADGMGGHAGGEVAAQVAVDALREAFARHATLDGLRQAVGEANAAVWRQSQQRVELRGMGTTLTAAALVAGTDGRDVIALANVGDSRAYLFSGGRVTQVTADHSLAEEKVRHGELTEAEAAVHPHRHILTRALGVAAGVEVDLWELHLQVGDRLLLCSDGLTNEVDPAGIAGVLSEVADPTDAARHLVAMANEHGGNDNITVVVVDVLVGDGAGAPQGLTTTA